MTTDDNVMPELKQLLGALVFSSTRPLSVAEMRRCLKEVAQSEGGAAGS